MHSTASLPPLATHGRRTVGTQATAFHPRPRPCTPARVVPRHRARTHAVRHHARTPHSLCGHDGHAHAPARFRLALSSHHRDLVPNLPLSQSWFLHANAMTTGPRPGLDATPSRPGLGLHGRRRCQGMAMPFAATYPSPPGRRVVTCNLGKPDQVISAASAAGPLHEHRRDST